jgi:hypothetical protein
MSNGPPLKLPSGGVPVVTCPEAKKEKLKVKTRATTKTTRRAAVIVHLLELLRHSTGRTHPMTNLVQDNSSYSGFGQLVVFSSCCLIFESKQTKFGTYLFADLSAWQK